MRLRFLGLLSGIVAATALMAMPTKVEAFCGFYVSGADSQLYNNATQVVNARGAKDDSLDAQQLPGASRRLCHGRSGPGRSSGRQR